MRASESSGDGLSWNQWLTIGILLQKTTGEESCYAERDLFENVFHSWASLCDDRYLLSASAAERWMTSFAGQKSAEWFGGKIFPLMDRDGDGYIQVHEFVLGMIVLLKDTCCTPPPCPALVKSQRQLAFLHYDQDKDGLLGSQEWTNFVNDCLIPETKPVDASANYNLGNCVRGVSQCLAARNENELVVSRRRPRTGLLWAEDFWIERRMTISYDAFYEAIERGMFLEPRSFMELDLIRPALYTWVTSTLAAQQKSVNDRGDDLGKIMTDGFKLTANMLSGLRQTVVPMIAEQAKAGFNQAISLLTSDSTPSAAPMLTRDKDKASTPEARTAPIPVKAMEAPVKPMEVEATQQQVKRAEPLSNSTTRTETLQPSMKIETALDSQDQFGFSSSISNDVPQEPILRFDFESHSGARAAPNCSQTPYISVPSTESPINHCFVACTPDIREASVSRLKDPSNQKEEPQTATRAKPAEELGTVEEQCFQLAKIYLNQLAWIMKGTNDSTEACSYSDLMLLCESVGLRMMCSEKVLTKLSPTDDTKITFVGEIGGDLERTRKIIREVCTDGSGFWRLAENSIVIFTGNVLSPSVAGHEAVRTRNLDVLITIWAFKAMYPERVFLLRGRNEACSHKPLLDECQQRWGAENGKQIWNVLLDTWEMTPLVYQIGNEGCVYGASFTGAVEAILDNLDSIERPFKIDLANTKVPKSSSDGMSSGLWNSSGCSTTHSTDDQIRAISHSYRIKSSRDFVAAVIRLRTRFGLKWIIQDQFVTSTSKVEHSRWFNVAHMRLGPGQQWILDSYRGEVRERIWPMQSSEEPGKPVERDIATLTTGDGGSPSPSTSEDIEKFLHPLVS